MKIATKFEIGQTLLYKGIEVVITEIRIGNVYANEKATERTLELQYAVTETEPKQILGAGSWTLCFERELCNAIKVKEVAGEYNNKSL